MNDMINILVVEDDNDINQLLCRIIKMSNYHPQPAYSGTEALLYLEKQQWDLVLLDLMLPGMAGEEVLEKITEKGSTPVIIISAKNEKRTKITSLRKGADDFISKPFDIDEVSARIDSLLRRTRYPNEPKKQILTHKDIQLDLDSKTVLVNGVNVSLTAREFNILKLLMTTPYKVFSKANVFESVWNEPYHGDDNTVNVHVSNLRNKLTKANPNEEYIETIWGMGYRMKS
ncbi:response regulator transcription factor [Caldibacillus thermolactis]|jgi:DNA-binding response OmpR family regulator|uniref:Response regulator transcription factor n=2 Tax=Bacillales TaxID=1385 RepID=A0ABW0RDD5_9BACL|nr:response regulator transcription factor [Pallidibacillus thermolactis]MCU9593297.1 response regulator transcription factor [Pallidibacillus thermolactis]MCU9602749.1 response regulator transcription factor [Pallidibacillus thermolactis subsp. kokeshiiformis]MED1674860.1 response regulator transcription factor [Pallidibacillus thermolactis subsp. kokeshiiformis]